MDGFTFEHCPGTIRFGRGCIEQLDVVLTDIGVSRPLVVCGTTIGSTPSVIDPVTDGIGDRPIGIFDRTTPAKSFHTAVEGRDRIRDEDIDALVAVGGGSSLDVAKAMAILAATDRSAADLESHIREHGGLPSPQRDPIQTIAVPTTLAGADLSAVGSITLPEVQTGPGEKGTYGVGGFADRRLMPDALVYEPALFETTPDSILAASAMNGFDKGIELLYSRNSTPITDATAKHGLGILRSALPHLTEDGDTLDRAIVGTILVQYGLSTPGTGKLSIIHAFGHGLARHYPVQQGAAHGIVAPAVLEYVFDRVDGRRRMIAEGLGVEPAGNDVSTSIVAAVADLRDDLGLPSQLRTVAGLDRTDLPAIASFILDDTVMANRPPNLDPTQSEIEEVLEAVW